MTTARATAPIKALFWEALESLPNRTEDVTDDVFHAIEINQQWRRRYDALCSSRGKTTVNTWGGYWVANAVERVGLVQVPAKKSSLILTYSKLDQPAPPKKNKLLAEQAAREAVFAHYTANKATLPSHIAQVKEEIVELVMEGLAPAEAFAQALKLL